MHGITTHRFGPDDLDKLLAVRDGLFDNPMRPEQARSFLEDHLHELVLAYEGEDAVGMISAVVMFHPDKAPALFINEVGVRETHRRRGIATALVAMMVDIGRGRGCEGAWLGTETDNGPALALYRGTAEDELSGVFFGWDDGI